MYTIGISQFAEHGSLDNCREGFIQGLEEEGLRYMEEAGRTTGLATICEVTSLRALSMAAKYVDMLQIGARNMQNFELLKEVGRSGLPVMLKRGLAATVDEWLNAAEYIISEGNPNIVLCGTHDGYFKDSDPVAREVAQAQPDLLFVCLGAPKQEKWISRFGLITGAKLAIGLGGALDVFAGNVERAPEKWQKAGLEWAYRLKKEPKRIGRMAKLPLVLVKAAGRRVAGKGRQGVL